MSCEIGLDSPQIQDLVAFQIVRQLREQGHTVQAPAKKRPRKSKPTKFT